MAGSAKRGVRAPRWRAPRPCQLPSGTVVSSSPGADDVFGPFLLCPATGFLSCRLTNPPLGGCSGSLCPRAAIDEFQLVMVYPYTSSFSWERNTPKNLVHSRLSFDAWGPDSGSAGTPGPASWPGSVAGAGDARSARMDTFAMACRGSLLGASFRWPSAAGRAGGGAGPSVELAVPVTRPSQAEG